MITKSIYASGSKGHHKFTLNVQEDSTSTSDNSSLLSFKFIISATNSTWQWRSYNNITYSITIGTNTYTGTIPNFNGNTTTIKSVSDIEIEHNSDGTKTINVGFNVTDPNTSVNYTCGNASESSTMALTDLHTPPAISNVSIIERNPRATTNDKMTRYLSDKEYTITAGASDGATISKYRVYNGNELLEERPAQISPPNVFHISYSNVELQTTKISLKDYAIVKFEVEDSLGATTSTVRLLEVVDYQKPNIIATSSEIKRNGQSTGKVNLNLIATFYKYQVGSYYNDASSMSMSFAYWSKNSSESSTYYPIDITSQNPDVSISGGTLTITNWTIQKNGADIEDVGTGAYYFKIKLQDAFGKVSTVTLLCMPSEYLMCKFKDRVDFKKITKKNIEIPIIDSGYEDTITAVSGNNYLDIPITFNYTFASNPNINLTLVSASTAGAFGSITITVLPSSVSTTGFTARVFNAGSSSRDIRFYWLAIENVNQLTTTLLQEEI